MKVREPELPHIIIGTAGHVDHGKTSLIRFLTGCETDKLKEERERGMSINLGFAACMFPGNRVVGVVDVPGHIDFIRNMVAGAASIDILLLVIAADDGVMPQTIEHMQIVNLLRTPKVMVALTKIDLVDEDMLELAKDDVHDFLIKAGFPDAPVMPVSNVTFEGLPEILETLDEFIKEIKVEEDDRLFRMNVERTFSVKGMGTVATGIPASGHISAGENLELHPAGIRSSIRAIHNYKHKTDRTAASICSAINLRDIDSDDLTRGMTLAAPGVFTPVNTVLATFTNVSREFPLKHNTEVKFHSGTAETLGKVGLIESNVLPPGESTVVRITLDQPLVLVAGDKFVIRKLSPSITYGGGSIMAKGDYRFKRSSPTLRKRLMTAKEAIDRNELFEAELIAGEHPIITRNELMTATHLLPTAAAELIERKTTDAFLVELDKSTCIIRSRAIEVTPRLLRQLNEYHLSNPYSMGMLPSQAADLLELPHSAIKKLIGILREVTSEITFKNNRLALKSFAPKISSKLIEQKEQLQTALLVAKRQGLARGDVKKELGIVEADMKLLCKILIEEDLLTIIGNRLLSNDAFHECKQVVIEIFRETGVIDISDFRDRVGVSRNIAVTLLEKFDSLGITRRTDEGRTLISPTEDAIT